MHIGKRLIVKHDNKIQEGIVEEIYSEDLDIRLDNGELIRRKFWETRAISYEEEK
jgi:hypothetical protein